MGIYLNPGNEEFARILRTEFVDKTGLIEIINKSIDTKDNLICISRPRRFGKSYAAQMLCAYYDCDCDSKNLFSGLNISSFVDHEKFINKYNVLYIDVTGFISELTGNKESLSAITSFIKNSLIQDINRDLPEDRRADNISDCLLNLVEYSGKKIVFIIDEWDAIIREAKNDEATQISFLNFLRGVFKNGNITPKVVAAAYMTGILPIKKDGTESAISDFEEYTILNPGPFSEFTGFTEDEVDLLCRKNDIDASKMKEWYDGYSFEGIKSVYNPYSVMQALKMRRYESYWQKTSAAESLFTYISMDYDGLQDDIARLITGERLEVDINTFKNDVENFSNKDDVLTLLIHLGYLSYRDDDKTVTIPNEEIRQEFVSLLKSNEKTKLAELVKKSESLLNKTLEGDGKTVALAINSIQESQYAPTFYNNEQALRYIVKFAYIVCVDQYLCIEELPSGKGIADVAFIPKKKSNLPAMIVELKWNKTEEAAIAQIRDKNYPKVFSDYAGEVIMVGINYDERTKEHSCVIEKLQK